MTNYNERSNGFDSKKYIVFDTEARQYIEVEDFAEYKDYILKRK